MTSDSADSGARPAQAGRAPSAATATKDPDAGPEQEPLLRLRGIGKNFGPVRALADINLDIPAGRVTAVVGDNGAGKTTLIKTIAGIWQPDHGDLAWMGRTVHLHSPRAASDLGIATVYQDLALCDNLDIVQNMFLGREPLRHRQLDEISMELSAKRTLSDLAVMSVRSIRQPVGSLSGGQRQAVAVAKAVMQRAKLVILDEPTAALGVSQTRIVLDLIGQLASRNIAVIVISHNLNQVMSVADRIAVLHLGQLAAAGAVSHFDTQAIVDLMTTGTSTRFSGEQMGDAPTSARGGRDESIDAQEDPLGSSPRAGTPPEGSGPSRPAAPGPAAPGSAAPDNTVSPRADTGEAE